MDAQMTFEEWAMRTMVAADDRDIPRDQETRTQLLVDCLPFEMTEDLSLRFCEGIAAYMLGQDGPDDPVRQAGYNMMETYDDRAWPRSAERKAR